MTVIATNFINLPFAHQILNAFREYSNEYEFTAKGVFRKIIPPACPKCGKVMSHNGSNKHGILNLVVIKLGRYYCVKCAQSLEEKNIFLKNIKFEITEILTGISQVLRNHDVSYEGISEVMDYLIPQSSDTICRRFSASVASVQLPAASPIRIILYDEQYLKVGRLQKYRLTLLNGVTHEVIAEEIFYNKSQETIKSFFRNNLIEIIDKSKPVFIVTDQGRGYAELIEKVFKGNAIHQYCIFHLNQNIAKEFSKQCPMNEELIKYRLFNIFYDREAELNYLKKVCEEEASINFKDVKEENEWRKKAKIGFSGFLHEQELKRRRLHKNLRLRNFYESYVIMNKLLNEAKSFSPIVQRRLEKIQENWNHFTAFQRIDDAPATNNAIENYYSTSLKDQSKKQLRTDMGINLHMKLSSLKRLGMIDKPESTFLEAILKLIPFRAAG
jgi:hypothetical protein